MVMKIQYISIDDLKEAEYNPRKITEKELEQLEKSFLNLGNLEPILVNRHQDRFNIIISGHQRVKVASRIGLDKIPAIFVEFDEEKEREANIRMNKNTGSFDFEILENEFDIGDLVSWGFDEDLFDGIINEPNRSDPNSGEPNQDETGIIQTNIVFDSKKQLETWYNFQRKINESIQGETFAARLTKHIIGFLKDAEN